MQLFTIFFSRPIEFGLATALTVLMLVILAKAAFSAQGPSGIGRMMARPSSKWLFGLFSSSGRWCSGSAFSSSRTRARTHRTAASA